jgi:RNA polymerase sigma-70 factor, ECF subfamily
MGRGRYKILAGRTKILSAVPSGTALNRFAKGAHIMRETPSVEELLSCVRTDASSLGRLLQHYQPYLEVIAKQRIDPRLMSRVCESDLVQQTLAEVAESFGEFRGDTEAEFTAWVHAIFRHVQDRAVRVHVLAEKRSVVRERPLYYEDGSASYFWFNFTSPGTSPSKLLVQGERALRLARHVEELPGKQGTAIRLRFFEGMKVRQIAEVMELSHCAVAGLLKRGIRLLRSSMNEDSWFSDAVSES